MPSFVFGVCVPNPRARARFLALTRVFGVPRTLQRNYHFWKKAWHEHTHTHTHTVLWKIVFPFGLATPSCQTPKAKRAKKDCFSRALPNRCCRIDSFSFVRSVVQIIRRNNIRNIITTTYFLCLFQQQVGHEWHSLAD